MENPNPRARTLIWSQVGYFLFLFPWLVAAATSTQLSIEPVLIAYLYRGWLWIYPLFWVASLLMTHRTSSRDQHRTATRWNMLPLAWIVPTVLAVTAGAVL